MSNKHRYPTISFRISPRERQEIEAKIKASGMQKKDYFVRSCIYNRVCVVGKKETIYLLVEKVQEMQKRLETLAKQLDENKADMELKDITELRVAYEDMLRAILWLLEGAKYLWLGNDAEKEKSPNSGNC